MTWYFRNWCALHQLHLIVKTQLSQLGTHFTDTATLVNVWRGVQTAIKIYKAWAERYGEQAAKKVKCLPPRPLSGRWGAIHCVERYLLKATPEECRAILPGVLSKPAKTTTKAKPTPLLPLPAPLDPAVAALLAGAELAEAPFEIVLDEQKAYQEQQSKWIARSLGTISKDMYWTRMARAHVSRGPIMRLQFSIQSAGPTGMIKLITRTHVQVCFDFSQLLCTNEEDSAWSSVVGSEFLSGYDDGAWSEITLCVLTVASNYHRRIGMRYTQFPFKLVWLIVTIYNVFCRERQIFAAYLLTVVRAKQVPLECSWGLHLCQAHAAIFRP